MELAPMSLCWSGEAVEVCVCGWIAVFEAAKALINRDLFVRRSMGHAHHFSVRSGIWSISRNWYADRQGSTYSKLSMAPTSDDQMETQRRRALLLPRLRPEMVVRKQSRDSEQPSNSHASKGTTGTIPGADRAGGMPQPVGPERDAGTFLLGPGRWGTAGLAWPTAQRVPGIRAAGGFEQLVAALWQKFSWPELVQTVRDQLGKTGQSNL